jgi:endonuclease/exonuclease/phosphatase family metal-dependent hydrolase
LRLATFNLENFGATRHAAPLAERIAVLRPQLVRLDADILCLQEIDPQPPVGAGAKAHPRSLRALDQLLDGTPYAGFHRAATKNRDQSDFADIHNVVLLSRWPFAEVRQLWHELVSEPLWRASTSKPAAMEPEPVVWDRPALVARVALPGGRSLHLAGLHLRAPLASPVRGQKLGHEAWRSLGGWAEGYVLSEMKRAGQALEIRLWLDRLFGAEREALAAVMGDLNAEEHHAPVEVILGRDDSIGAGVDTGGALAAGVLVPAERAVADGRRFSVRHAGRAQMLDHILVSRALAERQRGAEIFNDSLGDEATLADDAAPSPQSFHAPLVAAFDLAD